jgi:hypothetical protein
MRLDRAAIALEPRSIGSCIDLALVFVGRRFGTWLMLVACFAIPAGAAAYWAARHTSHGLLWSLLIVCLMSAPLGVCLVVAATHTAFSEHWRLRQVLWDGWWQQSKATWLTLLLHPLECALTLLCLWPVTQMPTAIAGVLMIGLAVVCLVPGIALGVFAGSFLAESGTLKQFRKQRHDHRTKDLVRQEFGELFGRCLVLWMVGLMLWCIVTITVDFASTLLFGVPLIFGRIADAIHSPWGSPELEELADAFLAFCTTDPVALCTLTVTGLCTYAVCRLAWFFAYVDLRIRRDCWDLEVALADEARRLETPT